MLAVNQRFNDNNHRMKRGLTGRLNVNCCSGRLVTLTTGRDKLDRRFFRGTSRGTSDNLTCTFAVNCSCVKLFPPCTSILSGSHLFLCRDSAVHGLTRGNSYIVIKQYTSCVLHSGPSYLDFFVRGGGRGHVRQVVRDRGLAIRRTRRLVLGASGSHTTCCGCCAGGR